MEYLPLNPNETDPINKEKTEKKLREFRQYIVDKGVVLNFVKVLLSLKYAENKPRNPIKAVREFFGNYNDPKWKEVEALKEKIMIYSTENPKLLETVIRLEEELLNLKRNLRITKLFKSYEADKNGQVGSKQIVEKLTGNKKFEVDEKFGLAEFTQLIESVSENDAEVEKEFIEKLERSVEGMTVYKEDLENTLYKRLVTIVKEKMKKVKK